MCYILCTLCVRLSLEQNYRDNPLQRLMLQLYIWVAHSHMSCLVIPVGRLSG